MSGRYYVGLILSFISCATKINYFDSTWFRYSFIIRGILWGPRRALKAVSVSSQRWHKDIQINRIKTSVQRKKTSQRQISIKHQLCKAEKVHNSIFQGINVFKHEIDQDTNNKEKNLPYNQELFCILARQEEYSQASNQYELGSNHAWLQSIWSKN